MCDVHARCRVNRHVDIAVAAERVGFTGEPAALQGNELLTTGIQLPIKSLPSNVLMMAGKAASSWFTASSAQFPTSDALSDKKCSR